MGRRPEVQEELHTEIETTDQFLPEASFSEKLSHMKHLDCVVKECFRIHNPVPEIGRNVEEDMEIGRCYIPAGAQVRLSFPIALS